MAEESTARSELLANWRRRPGPSNRQASDPTSPRSPRTPTFGRSISSGLHSPSVTFRPDDEIQVLELGSRYVRVGFGGESAPRCCLDFGPSRQRRAGDYSQWIPSNATSRPTPVTSAELWGRGHELWRYELRNLDLDIVSWKLERALREAFSEHVLVIDEAKKRKMMVVIPSMLPRQLLETMLKTLFNSAPPPSSVTLLPTSLMCTVGAGLRSALVVDIGWHETTVTAIYEYREVRQRKSTRAMKCLSWKVYEKVMDEVKWTSKEDETVSFDEIEEIVTRMLWCRKDESTTSDSAVTIPIRRLGRDIVLPFSVFADLTDSTFFPDAWGNVPDDHELSLPALAYSVLLHESVDVRNSCLSRIVVVGGGSNIPGLKGRLVSELSKIIASRGWDLVESYGSAKRKPRRTAIRAQEPVVVTSDSSAKNKDVDQESTTPAHAQPQLPDSFAQKMTEGAEVVPQCISTVGAWAGASIVGGLRLQGMVEVDRERFLQHGLVPPEKEDNAKKRQSMIQNQRQSLVLGGGGIWNKPAERSSWTLGMWM